MSAIGAAKDTFAGLFAPVMRYERHLSALAMVAGFGVDNATFGRIDRPGAHLIFGSYLALAAITIATSHRLQTRADAKHIGSETGAAPDEAAAVAALTAKDEQEAQAEKPETAGEPKERWRKYLPA